MEKAQKLNAVIYARFSSHGQTEQSIEGQLHDCYEYAEKNGYNVIGEYIDRALTGRYDDRPDFQRMIRDSSKKQFQFILVWKLDRFARNRYDSAMYKHILKKNGVRVISSMEYLTDTPEGIILEAMLEANAEYYSANLSQNVKRGQRESCEKGLFLGGNPPYGYKVIDKKVYIDEFKAEAVKYIFNSYASGMSKKDICRNINEMGYKNSHGEAFVPNGFQNILKNPRYTGSFLYGNKYQCDNMFPAIISQELFDRVQRKLGEKAHAPAKATAKADYLLSGKIYCGDCGTAMIGMSATSKTGTKHYYYSCGKKRRENNCVKKNEKQEFIEDYVCESAVNYVLRPEIINHLAKKIVSTYDDEFGNKKIKSIEAKISILKTEKNKAVDKYINTDSKELMKLLQDKVESLATQITDLEINLSQLKIGNKAKLSEEDIKKWLISFTKGNLADPKFKRHLIDAFINSIYVYDDKIVLYFNVDDGNKVSYTQMQEDIKKLRTDDDSKFDLSNEWQTLHNKGRTPVFFIFSEGLFGICVFR